MDKKTFNTKLGIDAKVTRETLQTDDAKKANQALAGIAPSLSPNQALKHMGSAAFHVYYSEPLKQLYVVSQTEPLDGCPELLAIAATKDFTGSIMEMFGHKRPVLRSGF